MQNVQVAPPIEESLLELDIEAGRGHTFQEVYGMVLQRDKIHRPVKNNQSAEFSSISSLQSNPRHFLFCELHISDLK
jgi:hypothetical protein